MPLTLNNTNTLTADNIILGGTNDHKYMLQNQK